MRHGFDTMSPSPITVHGEEARRISSKEEVQVSAFHEKGDAHRFLGYARLN